MDGKTLNPWCLGAALGALLTAGTPPSKAPPWHAAAGRGQGLHDVLPVTLKAQVTYTLHGHSCSWFPHAPEPSPHNMQSLIPTTKTGQGPGNGGATHTQCTNLGCLHTPSPGTIPLPVPAPTMAAPKEQPSSGREPGTACTHPACTWPGSPALGPGTTFQTAQPVPFPPPRRSKSFISLGASARGKGRSTWEPLPAPACAGR